MAFEVFRKSDAVYGRSPNVTVQPQGLMSINQGAYFRMGSPRLVLLMYDRENSLIGVQGTENAEDGHKVRVAKRPGSPAIVSASAFFNFYGIAPSETRRWTPLFEDEVLIIDLKDPGRTVGKRKSAEEE